MQPTILIVHNDRIYATLLADFLVLCDYAVCPVYSRKEAIEQLQHKGFDLALVQVAEPKDSALLNFLTEKVPDMALLALLAPNAKKSLVKPLSLPTNHIVALPAAPLTILAHIKDVLATLAKLKLTARAPVLVGPLLIDTNTNTAMIGDKPLTLTGTEFALLSLLASRANEAVSKDEIYPEVLGRPRGQYDRAIDVHISSIRHKLAELAGDSFTIESVRGVGYRFHA